MAKDDFPELKRRNRTMSVTDVLAGALDPALKKRGFASRDIIAHWPVIAPKPYDEVAIPDKLGWPRDERSAERATLVLRCVPGHALAISHEGDKIAAAINRYFGFVLVGSVRLSAEPFTPGSSKKDESPYQPSQSVKAKVGAQLADVENEDLREALRTLGHALASRSERKNG
ncbi:MAG: DciA family protein [Candidatus Devosia euplotis]|nr:DciA family protein [Candidatus Devosia euplotis]